MHSKALTPLLLSVALAACFISSTLAGKCCNEGFALNTSLICVHQNLPPSSFLVSSGPSGLPKCESLTWNYVSSGLPPDPYCVDFLESEVVAVACKSRSSLTQSTLAEVKKCCPQGALYELESKSCVNGTMEMFSDALLEVLANPVARVDYSPTKACIRDDVRVDLMAGDVMIDMDGAVRVGGTRYIPENTCVDATPEGKLVVQVCEASKKACNERRVCVSKCCPVGQARVDEVCVDSDLEFNLTFYYNVSGKEVPADIGIYEGKPCSYTYTLDPTKWSHDEWFLMMDGNVFQPAWNVTRPPTQYCLENFVTDGKANMVASVCFPEQGDPIWWVYWLYAGCVLVSAVCLFLTLLVYAVLPSLQNLHGKILMCYAASMLAAFTCLAVVQTVRSYKVVTCKILAYFLCLSFFAAFSWMNVICFDIWWTFGAVRSVRVSVSRKKRERRLFMLYSLYAWGVAIAFCIWVVVLNEWASKWNLPDVLRPEITSRRCFLERGQPFRLVFFVGPISVQVASNVVMFALTAWHCSRVKAEISRMQHGNCVRDNPAPENQPPRGRELANGGGRSLGPAEDRCARFRADKDKLLMNLKLFVVMGVLWTFEVLSNFFPNTDLLWILPDLTNALQGVFIFIIFVLKRKVLYRLAKRFKGLPEPIIKRLSPKTCTSTTFVASISSSPKRLTDKRQDPYVLQKCDSGIKLNNISTTCKETNGVR